MVVARDDDGGDDGAVEHVLLPDTDGARVPGEYDPEDLEAGTGAAAQGKKKFLNLFRIFQLEIPFKIISIKKFHLKCIFQRWKGGFLNFF